MNIFPRHSHLFHLHFVTLVKYIIYYTLINGIRLYILVTE
jgi:hypothetical protein